MRRALQKALAGGDIYVLVEYKKKKPSIKTFSIHCHMSEVVFSVWEMGKWGWPPDENLCTDIRPT